MTYSMHTVLRLLENLPGHRHDRSVQGLSLDRSSEVRRKDRSDWLTRKQVQGACRGGKRLGGNGGEDKSEDSGGMHAG